MTELVGARCRLRPYREKDAASLRKVADDLRVARWMTAGFPHPYTSAAAELWLRTALADDPPNNFVIEADGVFAGGIGILPQRGERAGTAIFGYWLGVRFWGRGIATEAAQLLARHALRARGLRRLEASVFADNAASARVLEKAGFTLEARCAEMYVQRDGSVCDGLLYARLARQDDIAARA